MNNAPCDKKKQVSIFFSWARDMRAFLISVKPLFSQHQHHKPLLHLRHFTRAFA
jgi:hypothetical protein